MLVSRAAQVEGARAGPGEAALARLLLDHGLDPDEMRAPLAVLRVGITCVQVQRTPAQGPLACRHATRARRLREHGALTDAHQQRGTSSPAGTRAHTRTRTGPGAGGGPRRGGPREAFKSEE